MALVRMWKYLLGVGLSVIYVFGTARSSPDYISYDVYSMCGQSTIEVRDSDIIQLHVTGTEANTLLCSITFKTEDDGEDLFFKFTDYYFSSSDGHLTVFTHTTEDGTKSPKGLYSSVLKPTLHENKRADRFVTVTVFRVTGTEFTVKLDITTQDFNWDFDTSFQFHEWVIGLIVMSCVVFAGIVISCIVCARKSMGTRGRVLAITMNANVRTGPAPVGVCTISNPAATIGYSVQNVGCVPQPQTPAQFQHLQHPGTYSMTSSQVICTSTSPLPALIPRPAVHNSAYILSQ